MNLLFVTASYPFGGITEQAFAEPDLAPLAARFDSVTVMPVENRGETEVSLPQGCVADPYLTQKKPGAFSKFRTLVRPRTWRALWHDRSQVKSLHGLRAALAYYAYVDFYAGRLHRLGIDTANTVVYTFWFDFVTCALSTLPGVDVLTRAHGHDIFEEEGFISRYWRKRTLESIRGVYTASENGAGYLRAKFPEYAHKIHRMYLGSRTPQSTCHACCGKERHCEDYALITVSRLAPVKRVPLLFESLKALCRADAVHTYRWVLVGDGPDRNIIEAMEREGMPPNLTVERPGALCNEDVHSLMDSRRFDAFLLASRSEGLPVAMCEALSHDIPPVATAVGGVPELLSKVGGVSLPPDFTTAGFIDTLKGFLTSPRNREGYCRTVWERNFRADTLRDEFAQIAWHFAKTSKKRYICRLFSDSPSRR